MNERRLSDRMIVYWEKIKGDSAVPLISAFNINHIHDMWPFCIRLKVHQDDSNIQYTVEHIGEKIGELTGYSLTGTRINSKMRDVLPFKILAETDKLVKAPKTEFIAGQFTNSKGSIIKYRSALLPLCSDDSLKITHIIAAISWQNFS